MQACREDSEPFLQRRAEESFLKLTQETRNNALGRWLHSRGTSQRLGGLWPCSKTPLSCRSESSVTTISSLLSFSVALPCGPGWRFDASQLPFLCLLAWKIGAVSIDMDFGHGRWRRFVVFTAQGDKIRFSGLARVKARGRRYEKSVDCSLDHIHSISSSSRGRKLKP